MTDIGMDERNSGLKSHHLETQHAKVYGTHDTLVSFKKLSFTRVKINNNQK